MSGIYSWIRNIACYLCIFNVVLHIIPGNGFKRYVRFIGGILLVLLVIAPLGKLLDLNESFHEAFQMEGLKEELSDARTAREGLADLRSEKIDTAFEAEMKRQLEGIVKAYGYYPITTTIIFQMEEEHITGVEEVLLVISKKNSKIDIHVGDSKQTEGKEPIEVENMKKDIKDVYQVPVGHINIDVRE